MIYEVKKDDVTLEVDDNVFFAEQSEEFKTLFRELENLNNPGYAGFDNYMAYLTNIGGPDGLGRVLFSPVNHNI